MRVHTGVHLVTTANSHNGDGPPVTGRVIKFHKGALFNATSQSLLPALVFGTQIQSTNALNITTIVSNAVHTSMPLQVNWTIVALSLLMLAILQSVYLLTPRPSTVQSLQLDDGYGRTRLHYHSRCNRLENLLVRHPHHPSGQESGPLLRMCMLEVGQSRTPVFDHVIHGTPNEDIQHAVQRSDPAMPNVRSVTRRTDR